MGRPVEGSLRELIISRRRNGYLARYAWGDVLDRVMVARIRHQREAGDQEDEVLAVRPQNPIQDGSG
jgi:plasmid stabilization system protein ParE